MSGLWCRDFGVRTFLSGLLHQNSYFPSTNMGCGYSKLVSLDADHNKKSYYQHFGCFLSLTVTCNYISFFAVISIKSQKFILPTTNIGKTKIFHLFAYPFPVYLYTVWGHYSQVAVQWTILILITPKSCK